MEYMNKTSNFATDNTMSRFWSIFECHILFNQHQLPIAVKRTRIYMYVFTQYFLGAKEGYLNGGTPPPSRALSSFFIKGELTFQN